MTPFRFEHTHQLSQREYVAIWALLDQAPSARSTRGGAIVALGFACLFSRYTMLLGVVILGGAAFVAFVPHVWPGIAARNFREFHYLDGPVTYGADEKSVWARTPDFSAKANWRHVSVWRERKGWLILQGSGFPPVLLPIAAMQAQGAYDQVKAMAQEHAVEWNRTVRRNPVP